ncbi:pilus assembly protein PilM [Vibrio sp. DW001]|uniref:pilus assembly protein PilM n=1 Tax=Vibrio sp. DW001 TaxID=2912315 RepID=UPI0023AFC9D0|nr:pilus assembly protein PilM [Vibrio sp. DW001]WED26906.1 pilus assembly protein PilM [Vibrio sp. DW001]
MGESLIIGIDIGRFHLKAIVLNASSERYILKSYQQIISSTALFSETNLFNHQEIVKKLQILKQKLPRFRSNVAIFIPDNEVFHSVINIDSKLIAAEIQFAVEQALSIEFTIPIQDLNIDFVKIDGKNGINSSTTEMAVYATSREGVEIRINALYRAGFKPVFISSEGQSLSALLYLIEKKATAERLSEAEPSTLNEEKKIRHGLLHIEEDSTTMCCLNQGHFTHIKSLPLGLSTLKALGDEPFFEQLSQSLSCELESMLISGQVFDKFKFWLNAEVGGSAYPCFQIGQRFNDERKRNNPNQLNQFDSLIIEIEWLKLADLVDSEKDFTELNSYAKAIGIAVGYDIWNKGRCDA